MGGGADGGAAAGAPTADEGEAKAKAGKAKDHGGGGTSARDAQKREIHDALLAYGMPDGDAPADLGRFAGGERGSRDCR